MVFFLDVILLSKYLRQLVTDFMILLLVYRLKVVRIFFLEIFLGTCPIKLDKRHHLLESRLDKTFYMDDFHSLS